MFITDMFTITELSRLTYKSRPTLYNYINEYNKGNLDNIPYSFIKLFEMSKHSSKIEIIEYCNKIYAKQNFTSENISELEDLITLIKENHKNLDLKKLKKFILEETKND